MADIVSNIKFLEDRLKVIEARVVQSDDYKEMKVLKRMITELRDSITPATPPEPLITLPPNSDTKPESMGMVKKYVGTVSRDRDNDHSPVPDLKHGERVAFIYDTTLHLVKEAGGSLDIPSAQEMLSAQFGMKWDKTMRLANYVMCYNRLHPDNEQLKLLPERREGQGRVAMYKTIVYVGKERLSV